MEYHVLSVTSLSLRVVEFSLHFLLSLILLNKKVEVKKLILGSIVFTIIFEIAKLVLPQYLSAIYCLLVAPLVLTFIFKEKFWKSVAVYAIVATIVGIVDYIISVVMLKVYEFESFEEAVNYPETYKIASISIILILSFIAGLMYCFKFMIFENKTEDICQNKFAVLNNTITFMLLVPNLILVVYYHDRKQLPFGIIFLHICSIFILFFLNTYNIKNTIKLAKAEQDLIAQQKYSKAQQDLIDGLRTFKHDYSNTLQTMNSCLQYNKIDKLKEIFQQVMDETKVITTLDSLNPNKIKDPAVFGILNGKYQKSKENKVKMEVEVLGDTEGIDIEAYDLTRILGILLDNAIDAAKESKKKKVIFSLTERRNDVVFEITNTFSEKDINLEKIKEKGVSSKGKDRGLGLYKVEEIVNKYDSVENNTQIEGDTFIQILNISKAGVLVKN